MRYREPYKLLDFGNTSSGFLILVFLDKKVTNNLKYIRCFITRPLAFNGITLSTGTFAVFTIESGRSPPNLV